MIIHPDDVGPRFVRKRPWWAWPVLLGVSLLLASGLVVDRLASTSVRSVNNEQVTVAIQSERARATRENCQLQNERHHNTIRTLDDLVANRPPAERAAARAGAAQFKLLIDALVPVRNCEELVRRTVVESVPAKGG